VVMGKSSEERLIDRTGHYQGDGPDPSRVSFRCRDLYVEYQARTTKRVLEEVSFDVGEGEFVALLGGSGVGKTTLLRILGGLLPAGPGCLVTYRGAPVTGPPEGAVTVFQDYAASLLPWRNVERNVALGIEAKLPAAERRDRIASALDLVGLTAVGRDYPWQLSGGMQQRVQLARALVTRPSALLMDEPFGSLDAMTKSLLQDALQDIHQRTKTTVVFVTHDIDEAVYLSDRIIVLAGSPAHVSKEIEVELPRPRHQVTTKEDERYLRLRHQAYDSIGMTDHGGS